MADVNAKTAGEVLVPPSVASGKERFLGRRRRAAVLAGRLPGRRPARSRRGDATQHTAVAAPQDTRDTPERTSADAVVSKRVVTACRLDR
jgi:hypothetical protein